MHLSCHSASLAAAVWATFVLQTLATGYSHQPIATTINHVERPSLPAAQAVSQQYVPLASPHLPSLQATDWYSEQVRLQGLHRPEEQSHLWELLDRHSSPHGGLLGHDLDQRMPGFPFQIEDGPLPPFRYPRPPSHQPHPYQPSPIDHFLSRPDMQSQWPHVSLPQQESPKDGDASMPLQQHHLQATPSSSQSMASAQHGNSFASESLEFPQPSSPLQYAPSNGQPSQPPGPHLGSRSKNMEEDSHGVSQQSETDGAHSEPSEVSSVSSAVLFEVKKKIVLI